MRGYIISAIATLVLPSLALAQDVITPPAADNDMNIVGEDELSWEDAVGHRDIEVMRATENGLEAVLANEIEKSDQGKLLQLRKAVRRLEDGPASSRPVIRAPFILDTEDWLDSDMDTETAVESTQD